jgi:phosphohistidine phosphatase
MADGLSLYLVRHALAAERGEKYPDDDLRPLTPKGMERFREAVEGLAAYGVGVDIVLTSPLVRARQTADILAGSLPDPPRIVETDALRPGASLDAIVRAVSECCGGCSSVALVGHEPGIGEIAGRLVGMSDPLAFNKGAVCRIDFDEWPPRGAGRLRWFVTQKILRTMAD